jgi:hypothetical protein
MLHPCRLLWLDVGDNNLVNNLKCPRGLRRGFAAARLLGLRVRIPPVALRSVSCDCSVLSDRGLCEGLLTRPEKFYRVWWDATVIVYTYNDWIGEVRLRKKQLRSSTNSVTPHVDFSRLLCYLTACRAQVFSKVLNHLPKHPQVCSFSGFEAHISYLFKRESKIAGLFVSACT